MFPFSLSELLASLPVFGASCNPKSTLKVVMIETMLLLVVLLPLSSPWFTSSSFAAIAPILQSVLISWLQLVILYPQIQGLYLFHSWHISFAFQLCCGMLLQMCTCIAQELQNM